MGSMAQKQEVTPQQRLTRMLTSFAKKRAVLAEDYDFFTTPRESTPPSKAARKSAPQSARQVPRLNGKRSSGRSGD